MKKKLVFILLVLPMFLVAQKLSEKGIGFETSASWAQIQAKAKSENKFIFVDCYATWCVPCKEMDKYVYSSEIVGNLVNNKFISVKIQMDTSTADHENTKAWYSIAQNFRKKYNIQAYPTYLFFSPEGKIIHRGTGYKFPEDFLKLINDAADPTRQVYTQLERYNQGIKDFSVMPLLAKNVYYYLQDADLAFKIASDFNKNYLNKARKEDLLKKENIEFITWYPKVLRPGDKYFEFFLNNAKQVDSVMNRAGFSSKTIDFAITLEHIYPKIYKKGNGKPIEGNPDWKKISTAIQRKYGKERAERNVLDAQIGWYLVKRDWDEAIKYNIIKIDRNGIDTSFWERFGLNNFCYDVIFKHSFNKTALNKGISWMEEILKFDPSNANQLDTYANLLYKIGRVSDAIVWQEKAVKLAPDNKGIQECLQKMRRNEPTWLSN